VTIWLKFSDSGFGFTAIHGGTVDGVIDTEAVLGVGVEKWLQEHLDETGYGENLPTDVIAYLGHLGWHPAPELNRDNGYVSAAAFQNVTRQRPTVIY
jgi:hypothetical protein